MSHTVHGAGDDGRHTTLRVLELFAGVGGWRCAAEKAFSRARLESADPETPVQGRPQHAQTRMISQYRAIEIVAAIDVNCNAKTVYESNFFSPKEVRGGHPPHRRYLQRDICHFSVCDFQKFDCDLWMMSPPCQVRECSTMIR